MVGWGETLSSEGDCSPHPAIPHGRTPESLRCVADPSDPPNKMRIARLPRHSQRGVRRLLPGPAMTVAAMVVACGPASSTPPEIIVDRTACDHCLMLISEPIYSAAFRIGERQGVFDDIGCLLDEVAGEPDLQTAQIWFHDVRDGSWINAADAVFVRSSQIPTPMASGIVAVADRSAAMELATRHDGEIIDSFAELLDLVARAEVRDLSTKDGSHEQ